MLKYLVLLINLMVLLNPASFNLGEPVNVVANIPAKADPGQEFTVEITLEKGSISGFAKLQQEFPAGFTVKAVKTQGATFTFTDQKAKFIWMSLPADPKFTVSYKVSTDAGTNGTFSITGTFSYIENNETKKFALSASNITVGTPAPEQPAASTEPPPSADPGTTPPATDPTTPPTQEPSSTPDPAPTPEPATSQEPPQPAPTPEPSSSIPEPAPQPPPTLTNVPAPQHGVIYRTQICAVAKPAPEGYFRDNYNITETIHTDMHQGLHKYMIGTFTVYKDARDYRNQTWEKGIKDAWVVCYNNGQRITVQEALMITKNKWMP